MGNVHGIGRCKLILAAMTTMCVMASAGGAGAAQRPASTSQSALSPLSADIAGVRLGMPIAEVIATLAASYRCETVRGERTFIQKVDDEVEARRTGSSRRLGGGLGTAYETCVGPGGEEFKIDYAEVPAGAVVSDIWLKLPSNKFDPAATMRQVKAKYGRFSLPGNFAGEFWCDPGYRCDLGRALVEGPQVKAYPDVYGVYVNATRGQRANKADAAAVIVAADKVAPKKTRGAF